MIDDTSGARRTAVQESDPEGAEQPTERTGEQVNAEAGTPAAAEEAPSEADTATDGRKGAATQLPGDGNGAAPAGADSPATEATADTDPAEQAAAPAQSDADATATEGAAAQGATESAATESAATESATTESATTDAAAGDAAAGEAPVQAAVSAPEEPMTMAQLMDIPDNEVKSLKHGDVVEGTVVRIDPDEILVDFGGKSEGVVSNRELMGRRGPRDDGDARPELNVGDQVLVYVLQPESPEGHAVLSLRRAGLERKWRAMQERFDAGEIVEARVIDHNKGGLIVDLGVRGFVPISQIVDFPRRPRDEQPRDAAQEIAEKLQPFVGRTLRLKILEVNRKANRLILSEKVALYEERREKRDELFSSLETGQRVKGVVRSIAPFGVFVDLGGIDGLVHKSELSWNKVNNPEGAYEIGEEVEAEVIDINHERGRISLSIRRLQADPWQESVAKYNIGDVIDGTVTKLVNFGAFVRVEEGLEGLIHISELSNQRVAHPGDVVQEGQQVRLRIISLDSERHRLGLSLKQAEDRPAPSSQEREDRPKRDRGGRRDRQADYRPEDATSEPEGGIESSMAAAFASSGLLDQFRSDDEAARGQEQAAKTDAKADAPAAAQATAAPEPEAEADATIEPIDDVTGEGQIDQVADATAVDDELRESDAAGTAPSQTRGAGRPPASKPVADDAPGAEADETATEEPAEADAASGPRKAKASDKPE